MEGRRSEKGQNHVRRTTSILLEGTVLFDEYSGQG